MVGDPVIVHGSKRNDQTVTNRYDDWNIPWSTWMKGDAAGNPER
jgi:hypothetical protein